MATQKDINKIQLNIMTKEQYDSATISDNEFYMITDIGTVECTQGSATGSATQPIYINSDGVATPTSYSLAKSVPVDAVFTDTTYSNFTGASSSSAGTAGLVMAPSAGDQDKYLKGNGSWSAITISSGDVVAALGYTPYDSSNPSGYTANVGTVTSVNNVQPVNGNVTLSIPPEQVQADWDEANANSKAFIKNKPYIPSGVVVDQNYDPTSTDAQSGTAVAEAVVDLADKSLSNLNTTGENRLYALKGYGTKGEPITDEKLMNQVREGMSSTFGRDKFTIVGNATLTDGGGSYYSANTGYIRPNETFDIWNKSWTLEIECIPWSTPPTTELGQLVKVVQSTNEIIIATATVPVVGSQVVIYGTDVDGSYTVSSVSESSGIVTVVTSDTISEDWNGAPVVTSSDTILGVLVTATVNSKTFVVAGINTPSVGSSITISGTPSDDGTYTVSSATTNTSTFRTTIVVEETIPAGYNIANVGSANIKPNYYNPYAPVTAPIIYESDSTFGINITSNSIDSFGAFNFGRLDVQRFYRDNPYAIFPYPLGVKQALFIKVEHDHKAQTTKGTLFVNGRELISNTRDTSSDTAPLTPYSPVFGAKPSTSYVNWGWICLNKFRIKTKENGLIFTGAKTGEDIINTGYNEKVFGTLHYEDGIYSNFSNNNYLSVADSQYIDFTKPWVMRARLTNLASLESAATSSDQYISLFQPGGNGWGITYSTSGFMFRQFNYNGSWTITDRLHSTDFPQIYCEWVYDGAKYLFKYRANEQDYWQEVPVAINMQTSGLYANTTPSSNGALIIGKSNLMPIGLGFDINAFEFVVGDKLIFKKSFKIPYTESSIGDKIVDGFYKDRVQAKYYLDGEADYFVLEDNSTVNFSLSPQCTLSKDYVLTGTSWSPMYSAQSFKDINFEDSKEWEVHTRVYIGTDLNVKGFINLRQGGNSNTSLVLLSSRLRFTISEYQIFSVALTSSVVSAEKSYDVIFGQREDLSAFLKWKEAGETEYNEVVDTTNPKCMARIFNWAQFGIGLAYAGAQGGVGTGNIDLARTKIYLDKKLAYECVTPPHVTLPMGGLYEMTENKIEEETKYIQSMNLLSPVEPVYDEPFVYDSLLKDMKSTFDKSKFYIESSLIVTDNGWVSNFRNRVSAYATTKDFKQNLGSAKTWEIELYTTLSSNIANAYNSLLAGNVLTNNPSNPSPTMGIFFALANDGKFRLYLSSDGTSWDIANDVRSNLVNNTYVGTLMGFKFEFTGTQYIVSRKLMGSDVWEPQIVINSTARIYSTNSSYLLGKQTTTSDYSWSGGAIDLSSFTVRENGKVVFTGCKTLTDTIYSDDTYTVTGTLTSTDNVYSGFSSSDYITLADVMDFNFDWTIRGKVTPKYVSGSDTQYIFVANGSSNLTNGLYLTWDANKENYTVTLAVNAASTLATPALALTDYPELYFEIDYTKASKIYTVKYRASIEDEWLTETTTAISNIMQSDSNIVIGYATDCAFEGDFDMNEFRVYSQGATVFCPTLTIPYIPTSDGKKLVDSYYEDRVYEVYEKYGSAPYTIIDQVKECYELPKGSIYGSFGIRTLKDSYRQGANYYEVYSDGTIEQGGACESGVDVVFAKPFINATDYTLTVPYTAKTATGFTPAQTGEFIAKGQGYRND